jgi:protein-S-isoprenylcysteine O-methyltransferase Ste14
MNTEPEAMQSDERPDLMTGILKRTATIAVFLVLQAVILFATAGRIDWIWPWVYLGISLVIVLVNGVIMLRTSPETVAERGQPGETKDWDKWIGGLWGLALYVVVPVVAGLDARFGWTVEVSIASNIAGALLFVASGFISGWAMVANAYFSTAVRIQEDRGHTVCNTGPYGYMRHPGYLGFILQSIGVPILFGSMWALIPGLLAVALMVARTALEDRTLQAELPGYQEYTQEVRHRLIPGIW